MRQKTSLTGPRLDATPRYSRRLKQDNLRLRGKCVLLFTAISGAFALTACAAPEAELKSPILIQDGTVPIILTAPHGGTGRVPGVERERRDPDGNTNRDWRTDEITELLASRLQRLLGARPYVVMARFHRKYIDANEPESRAYEDPDARPYYLAYHATIRSFVDEVLQDHLGGLLIDIHGQSKAGYRDKICRGTRYGSTVTHLTRQYGVDALIGPNSILGRLETSGYEVFPPNVPPREGDEFPCYDGGYTVLEYGSHHDDGIDALQLEIGRSIREDGPPREFVEALAEAIAVFYEEYLVPPPATSGMAKERDRQSYVEPVRLGLLPRRMNGPRSAMFSGDSGQQWADPGRSCAQEMA